jgi:DNA invertase Pin-like site-specific DNA recombinase
VSGAVAYIRKSVVQKGAMTLSWEMQEADVRAIAERRGDTDILILSDWGKSGRKGAEGRPGYRTLLEMIEGGQVRTLYAYSLSRLSRSLIEYSRLADLCVKAGVRVHFAKEGEMDFASPAGRLIVNILASVAQMEAELAQERSRDMVRARRARGDRLGRAPYGSRAGEDRGAVVAAFQREGSLHGAARALNAAGVPTREGRPWKSGSVRDLLRRAAPELLPTHPTPGAKAGAPFRLARLLRCSCGTLLTTQRGIKQARYWCHRATDDPSHPSPKSVVEDRVLPWVQAEIGLLRVPDPDVSLGESGAEDRERIDEALRRNKVAFLAGDMEDHEYLETKKALDTQLERLDAEGRVVRVEIPDLAQDPKDVNEWLRAVLEYVQMDEAMRPSFAVWRVPQWRASA